jgi:hypothetical protein
MTRAGHDPAMDASVADQPGFRRLCMMIDLESYSKHDGPGQLAVQAALEEVLDKAARDAGLRRETWFRQDSGDGELAVLPATEPDVALVGTFPLALEKALGDLHRRDDLLLRLRVAINHGPAQLAAKGYAGAGVIEAGRLADARVVRTALARAPQARLVLALSERLFTDVVRGGYTPWRPSDFRRLPIEEEKFQGAAWVRVPGVDPGQLTPGPDRAEEPTEEPAGASVSQRATATNSTVLQSGRDITYAPHGTVTTIHGDLNMPYGHIGPRHG